ncbi:MAG: hypothetical protein JWO79_740 [Actinomycetia bacterium]|nr:hypothetical protein [Actinomycetes bacterium]
MTAPELDRAVADRIHAYQPSAIPPFGAVRTRRNRWVATRSAGAVVAVLAVGAAVLQPWNRADHHVVSILPAASPSPAATAGPHHGPNAADRAAEKRWRAHGLRTYSMDLTVLCECHGGGMTVPVRVELGGLPPTPSTWPSLTSIDGIFERIDAAQDARITAKYDPVYGFPTQITFDQILNAIDDETSYTITNFRPH